MNVVVITHKTSPNYLNGCLRAIINSKDYAKVKGLYVVYHEAHNEIEEDLYDHIFAVRHISKNYRDYTPSGQDIHVLMEIYKRIFSWKWDQVVMIEHDLWVKDGWLDSLTSKNLLVSEKPKEKTSPVQYLNLTFVNGYYIMCNYGAQILLFHNTEAWYQAFCNIKNENNIPPDLWIVALASKQMWTLYPVGYNKGRLYTEHVGHGYLKQVLHEYHDPLPLEEI